MMGELTGLFYFDQRPLAPCDIADFLEPSVPGQIDQVSPGVLMLCRPSPWRRASDPQSRERAVTGSGNVCHWDGRLHNRSYLESCLGSRLREERGDAALALAAYESRGTEGLHALLGDFSLAIWDVSSRTILLASDYAGVRPLYYQHTDEYLAWSSSLKKLAEFIRSKELDEDFVAEFLALGKTIHRTPYRGLKSVPPGCVLQIGKQLCKNFRFWQPPLNPEARFRSEQDYADQLRALLQEAVSCRLTGEKLVAAELSGGLDSTSVVCTAARSANPGSLFTFSYVHPDSRDEKFYALIERHLKLPSIHIDIQRFTAVGKNQLGGTSPGWWQPRLEEVGRHMDERGAGTLLTGQLGDLIFGNRLDDSEQVGDALVTRQWRSAIGQAFAWSHSLGIPVYTIAKRAIRSSLWRRIHADHFDPAESGERNSDMSLTPGLRSRTKHLADAFAASIPGPVRLPSQQKHLSSLMQVLQSRTLQCPEPMLDRCYTHPYSHRPLVEFMFSIPALMVCRPGQPRYLMRLALGDLVPPAILKRRSKAVYTQAYADAVKPLAQHILQESRPMALATLGFVDEDKVRARIGLFLQSLPCNLIQLRHILLFEFWIRSWQQSATTA